ncbi:serine/threonine-protein kinase HipA [Segatella bryantii]|uniref:HipA N-terminal domain-containing protein n=1 Tax=Segatella bryantii TaxID=77095 RepID=UPI00089AA4F8|nr:HipA N-terminal domain-containing protein [Segatella bryantii]UKK75071.1 HipA N-terminal domain-containing protein [Segatella bryantii]SEA66049.1 serine/threonine-protein kinase HipA [Segatella bryantii]
MKQAGIYVNDNYCGLLTEDEEGFHFAYDEEYLARQDAAPVSPTMPLTKQQQDLTKMNRPSFIQTPVHIGILS